MKKPQQKKSGVRVLFAFMLLFMAEANAQDNDCALNCQGLGLASAACEDWRQDGRCYIRYANQARIRNVLCLKTSTGRIRARAECMQDEIRVKYQDLQGPTGATGPAGSTGPTGAVGPAGADGTIALYGDGSAGAKTVSTNETLNVSNPQFTDFIIESGATLVVAAGTVIRCTGDFENYGTIEVQPGFTSHPHFADNGALAISGQSSPTEALGGEGGRALSAGAAKMLLVPGLLHAGNGQKENYESGSLGGGAFVVMALNSVLIGSSGTIIANGEDASAAAKGGGGGGLIVLASSNTVINHGAIQVNGADGGAALPEDSGGRGYGPGGGGGGGIVHLLAPVIEDTGTVQAIGGSGGVAGTITGFLYFGGGGGGGSGGNGGDGGAVNPGNIGNGSTTAGYNGAIGQSLTTTADPLGLFLGR